MVVLGQKLLYSGKILKFGLKWLYRAKWFYLGKRGCIRAKMVVLGHKWLYSGILLYSGKKGCIGEKRLYWDKIVLFEQT